MRAELHLLSPKAVESILEDAEEVLRKVGVGIEDPRILGLLGDHGARTDAARKRAFLPPDLVGRSLKTVPHRVSLWDRGGLEAALLGEGRCHFAPGSAALKILDPAEGVRGGRRADLDRLARLVERIPAYPIQSTSLVPSDVPAEVADRTRLYHALRGCRKPVVTGTFREDGFEPMVRMLEAVRGSLQELRERPLAVFDCCPTPPLQWSRLTSDVLVRCAGLGIPATLIPMPLAGATGPGTLHGCLVQIAAEGLSGVVIHQCAGPGSPLIWGGCPTGFDMRHGTTPSGAPETVLLNAASVRLARRLGLPSHGYLALSDAASPDIQAGFETAMGALAAVLSGMDLAAGPGLLRFIGCLSLEKLVFDAEICEAAHRFARGIEIHGQEDLPGLFAEAAAGRGFLGLQHTRRHHREELTMPGMPVNRREGDSSEALESCRAEVERLLGGDEPEPLPPEAAAALDEILEAELRAAGE